MPFKDKTRYRSYHRQHRFLYRDRYGLSYMVDYRIARKLKAIVCLGASFALRAGEYMTELLEQLHVTALDGVVIDPQPAADYEFLVHHLGRRFWVDCWVVVPAYKASRSIKIKLPWMKTIQDGPDSGKLHVYNSGYRYRWLRSADERARLRKKASIDETLPAAQP